jgi:hypothetical protein
MEAVMAPIIAFFQSEMGRRILAWILVCLGGAANGGILPLDYAIPVIGLTTGQLFTMLGIGVATTSGSSSRT